MVQRLWMNSRSSNLQSRSTFTSINVITITEKTMKQTLKCTTIAIFLQLIKHKNNTINNSKLRPSYKTHFTHFRSPSIFHIFHKSPKKFPNKTDQEKSWTARLSFQIQFKKLISRYVILPFLYSKSKFTDLSKISSALSPTVSSPTDATTVPSVFKASRKKEERIFSPRIEISSNHFATPTSNTFARSLTVEQPRRSINQPDKRDGFEAQTEGKSGKIRTVRTCVRLCLPPQCVDTVAPLDKKPLAFWTMYENRINTGSTRLRRSKSRSETALCKPGRDTFYYLTTRY